MGIHRSDIAALQVCFDSLDGRQRAAQWGLYVDALDKGGAGFHPYHLVLSPRYQQAEAPAAVEREACRQVATAAWGQLRTNEKVAELADLSAYGEQPF